jgi:hypothetical protein
MRKHGEHHGYGSHPKCMHTPHNSMCQTVWHALHDGSHPDTMVVPWHSLAEEETHAHVQKHAMQQLLTSQ